MKKRSSIFLFLGILLSPLFVGCQSSQSLNENTDILYQYSTLGSLMAGVYDGELTFGELKEHGDFGLGTFNTLDGEMIEIDNQVYQVKSDGVVYKVDDAQKTPFSVVTYFEADQTEKVNESMDCDTFKAYIDGILPTKNLPYAIKITGTFSYMKTRSVPSQVEPYPPLLDVIAVQPTFEFEDVEGVMLGFRLPDYMDVANSPGYHFHFLNDEKNAGGHVLACQVENVTIEIDITDEWYTQLPADEAFYSVQFTNDQYK
jgi:acetolactate decarboxylase